MTHPHEGLQERALREALDGLMEYLVVVGGNPAVDAHRGAGLDAAYLAAERALSTPPIPQDQGMRDALDKILSAGLTKAQSAPNGLRIAILAQTIGEAREALSILPRQAATDEVEGCPFCGCADTFVEQSDFSSSYVVCNNCSARGPVECQEDDDEDQPGKDAAIRSWSKRATPTSQPPAAETRLREALEKCRAQFDFYATEHRAKVEAASTAFDDAKYWGNVEDQDKAWKELEKRRQQTVTNEGMVAMIAAALTQPEPTAQRGGDDGTVKALERACEAFCDNECNGDRGDHEAGCRAAWAALRVVRATLSAQQGGDEGELRKAIAIELERGEDCSLSECPPGLFLFGVSLHFKSEYSSKVGQPDAYCLDSGEYFWGGVSNIEARRSLIVTPLVGTSSACTYEITYHLEALSSQQAAGEAEAVSDMFEAGYMPCAKKPLATPQPTETQRIVAWQPIETAPKNGRWFIGKTRPGEGFGGNDYPPTVMRVTRQRTDWNTGKPSDEWDIEAKALNSGSSMFKLSDFDRWAPLPDERGEHLAGERG